MFAQTIKALKGEEKKNDTSHLSKGDESQELVENSTVDKMKRKISRRQTTTQITARKTLSYKNKCEQS